MGGVWSHLRRPWRQLPGCMPAALYSGLPILTLLLKHTKSWSITLWARVALMYDSSALTGLSGHQLCPLVLHPLNSAESPTVMLLRYVTVRWRFNLGLLKQNHCVSSLQPNWTGWLECNHLEMIANGQDATLTHLW